MQKENSKLKAVWLKIPMLIRTILIGSFVNTFGVSIWVIFSITIPGPWSIAVMASLVVGICEETGFRGYLQTPLEKRYNPKIAIVITSVVFVVVHLHQAWAGPILFQIFFISVLIGLFAYAFDSLIPGIIAHVTLDIFNFSFWWSDLLGEFTLKPISVTGIDHHFILTTIIFFASILIFIFINIKVIEYRKKNHLKMNTTVIPQA